MLFIIVITFFLYSFLSFTSEGQAAAAAARSNDNIFLSSSDHRPEDINIVERLKELMDRTSRVEKDRAAPNLKNLTAEAIIAFIYDKKKSTIDFNSRISSNSNTAAQASAAASPLSADVNAHNSETECLPWVRDFFEKKVNFVAQRRPDIFFYFDLDILQALACSMDTDLSSEEDRNLREIYLWKLFLSLSDETFKNAYESMVPFLRRFRLDGTIPFDLNILENGLYKNVIISALKECSDKKMLNFQKTEKEIVLSEDSKKDLTLLILHQVNIEIKFNIDEFRKRYQRYSSDKVPRWFHEYIKKDPKVVYKDKGFVNKLYLPTILARMVYDMNEYFIRGLNEEEKRYLDTRKRLEENDQEKHLSGIYKFFHEKILKNFYDNFTKYKIENLLAIEDEEVISLMAEQLEEYPYNMFHVDPLRNLRLTADFLKYFIANVTEKINSLIKNKSDHSDLEIPTFFTITLKSFEGLGSVGAVAKDSAKGLRSHEMQELAGERYRQQQQLLEARSQEHEEKKNQRDLQLKKAAENKVKREEEKRELEKQQRRAEEEKRKKDEERNKLRSEEGLRLQSEKSKQLNILLQKKQEIASDFAKRMRVILELSQDVQNYSAEKESQDFRSRIEKLKSSFNSVIADIDKQRDILTQLKDKDLKKATEEFTVKFSNFEHEFDDILSILKEIKFKLRSFLDKTHKTELQSSTELRDSKGGRIHNPYGLYERPNPVNSYLANPAPQAGDNPAGTYFDTHNSDGQANGFRPTIDQAANQRGLVDPLLGNGFNNRRNKLAKAMWPEVHDKP